MTNDCCAMHTGRTRQEARQQHRVALKEVRRQSKLSALLASRQVRENDQSKLESMYAGLEYNPTNQFESSSNVQCMHRRSGTSLPTLHRVLMLAFIASMFVTSVYADIDHDASDGALPRIAKIAVSTSQLLSMQMPGIMMAKALISALPSVNPEGMLDHKLGGLADQAVLAVQDYHEYAISNPVKAQLALSGFMVLAKTATAAIAGGLATAPAGGEGAIPAALYTLSKAIVDEMRGIVAGKAVDLVIGDKLEAFMQRGIDEFASGLMYLDPSLTEQQAKYLSIILGSAALSSAEFTSVVNKLGHIDLRSFKIAKGYDFASVGVTPRMSLGKAIRQELEPELMQSAVQGFVPSNNDLLKTGFEAHTSELLSPSEGSSLADRLFSAQAYQQWKDQSSMLTIATVPPLQPIQTTQQPSFTSTAQEIFQHQAYQQWKAESSNVLQIPPQRPIDMIEHYVPTQPQFIQVSGHGGGHDNQVRISINFRL